MRIDKKVRLQLLIQNAFFVILFIAAMILLAVLAKQYNWQKDLTSAKRNSVSQASIDILNQLKGPVTITAYATPYDPQAGDIRKMIGDFMLPYQRKKSDLTLEFIDPTEQPKAAEADNVRMNGEMVVRYNGRNEHLTEITEQAFVNLLTRLARGSTRQIMSLEGHGERRIDGSSNLDISEFNRQLSNRGFKTAPLNLAIAQDIPSNINLLVLTHPKTDLLKGEVDKLITYIDQGGNLLWLIDQEPLHGLQPLVEKLGLILSPGIVIDPAAQQLKAPISWSLGASYGQHPITQEFKNITTFPLARLIDINIKPGWSSQRLIEVAPQGWIETSKIDKKVTFDKSTDTPGPINIALALSRPVKGKNQRIVIMGTGYFLANAYLGYGANLDLGLSTVSWLTGDENLITIQPKANIDSSLILNQSMVYAIAFTFLVALPILFLGIAGFLWWYRRRA